MASHQTLDASPPPSSSKKKKHSKKHRETDVPVDAAAAAAPVDGTPVPSSKKKKHSKKRREADVPVAGPVDVTVDASFAGTAAPVVGYFPTGYDPLTADQAPGARLFRHEKHHNRVELVVSASGKGPDFVGRSYAGEAAAPQLCGYALGVLDKASGTLKIVPIASNKILRLEPHFEVQQPAHSQQSALEAGSSMADIEFNRRELTLIYGTKNDKIKDHRWMSLKEQRDDPSAYQDLDLGESKTTSDASDNQESMNVRNIPPYDPTADTSEKAYLLDEIIPKNIRAHLLDIVGHFESGEFASKGYGSFVSNRVNKLHELQGEDQERLAWILSYITHLLTLLAQNSSMSKHKRKEKDQARHGPVIPDSVHRRLLLMFIEPGSSALSSEKHELLINYILVLTLFADDFRSETKDICADLKMTHQMLKPYYDQLGCKSVTVSFKPSVMTLPAPLKFPLEVTRRKRQRR